MMAETVGAEEKEPWQIKEAIIGIPLLSSALAITYDVGYFYGLDMRFFTFFSLSGTSFLRSKHCPSHFLSPPC